MFVQLGYGFPSAAGFAGVTQSVGQVAGQQSAQASPVAPTSTAPGHTTANSTNATAVAQTSNQATNFGSAFAAPQFSVPQFAVTQGAVGFVTPFGLVAGGFGGFEGIAQSAPVSSAPANTQALNSDHQISNPTSSLDASGASPSGEFSFGAPSAALPFLLSPGFTQTGAPVVLALPLFAFGFIAAPVQQAPIQQAPIQQAPGAIEAPSADAPEAAVESPAVPRAPEAPVVAEPVIPPVVAPVIDVAPIVAPVLQTPEVVVSALTNAEFARYEQEQISSELETQLKLSLTTAEGDTITLDFSQLDVLQRNTLSGVDANDQALQDDNNSDRLDRLVNLDIQGDISADEQAAIDALLEDITSVAQKFFTGNLNEAASLLADLDFDTSTLSELSLKLSFTHTTEIRSGYREGFDQLDQLSSRGGEVNEVLDFLATEQRRLIDRAKESFDDASAVQFVTSLIPPLLEQPAALDALAKLDARLDALAEDGVEPQPEPEVAG